MKYNILKSNTDGIFDTDGSLVQDYAQSQFIYMFHYKNEFIVMDLNLNVLRTLNTIDTINKPQIEVKSNKKGVKRFSAPPLIVNKLSIAHKGILINQSKSFHPKVD